MLQVKKEAGTKLFLANEKAEREKPSIKKASPSKTIFCHKNTDLPIVRFFGLTFGGRYNVGGELFGLLGEFADFMLREKETEVKM
ncbi:MAG: hypothetical protein ACYCDV_08310 [Facklamia hominis]